MIDVSMAKKADLILDEFGDVPDSEGAYLYMTGEAIARECVRIQSSWSDRDHRKRECSSIARLGRCRRLRGSLSD